MKPIGGLLKASGSIQRRYRKISAMDKIPWPRLRRNRSMTWWVSFWVHVYPKDLPILAQYKGFLNAKFLLG